MKTCHISRTALSLAMCIVGLICVDPALGQGTALTYQGQLKVGGTPANGNFSMTFRIFDASGGGSQIGPSVAQPAVAVANGLFTTTLDFGTGVFTGPPRWLEIEVNANVLSPRQQLTGAPYAQKASDLRLPFDGTASAATPGLKVSNAGAGEGLHGVSGGGNGVYGRNSTNNNDGYLGGPTWALSGRHGATGNYGIFGHPTVGAYGENGSSHNYGGFGTGDSGAYGVNFSTGNTGYLGKDDYSVYGISGSQSFRGGLGGGLYGALGQHVPSQSFGGLGGTDFGVFGVGFGGGSRGVHGEGVNNGVEGYGYNGIYGESGTFNGNGVQGLATNGTNAYGIWGISSIVYAGYFNGKVHVGGTLTAAVKSFRIDHPTEPENKFLIHACVESDQMKNVYDGIVALDEYGQAWVDLPRWFEGLNSDFRYQLTCLGEPAPIYVKEKVSNNRFLIAGGKPGMEVSWQVTGVRRDAYARSHPLQVEVEKEGAERGRYLYPEAFGLTAERGIDFEKLQALEQSRSSKQPLAMSKP